MDPMLFAVVALLLGLGAGWYVGNRQAAAFRAERDARLDDFRQAIADLAAAEERAKQVPLLQSQVDELRRERDEALRENAEMKADSRNFDARMKELMEAKDALSAQFSEVGAKLLGEAQKHFLERADACSAEKMDMRQCIRTCMDCADICDATFKVATRRTGNNELLMEEMLTLCITACDICAEECARHDNDHCRRCAEMCRECAGDCRAALETF